MKFTSSSSAASLALALLVGCLVLSSAQRLEAQTDPMLGTWKLNLAKSTYEPGPPPQSETRIYEAFGKGGLKATFNYVDAQGVKSTRGYSALFDGKDYKYIGTPSFDTIAITRVNANTMTFSLKKGGAVAQTGTAVLSADGKTRTGTQTGTNAAGQTVHSVTVYEKQ
jgi:hypothetical protein